MCLGIPAQVLECGEHYARCASRNGEVRIDLSLVGQQQPGTWLLTFLDAAREVIDAERQLFDSELGLAQVTRGVQQAVVQLYRALGGGAAESSASNT